MNRRIALALCLAAVPNLLLAQGLNAPQGRGNVRIAKTLEGSWEVTISQRTPFPLNLRGLFSFHAGGTLTGTDEFTYSGLTAPTAASSLLQSPSHGEWIRTGANEFVANVIKLNFAANGTFAGRTILRAVVRYAPDSDPNLRNRTFGPHGELDTESLVGEFKYEIQAPNGVILLSGDGTVAGKRMQIREP